MWARAGKYKLVARAGDQAKGQGPGNTNTLKNLTKVDSEIFSFFLRNTFLIMAADI